MTSTGSIAQEVSINLTRDELLALLQLMGSSTINGLPEDPFAGVSQKERAERLNAGLETLLNRGLVEAKDHENIVIDDTLVALVGSCVLPSASMVLSGLQPDNSADPLFFSATPEIIVEHSSPRPGIHSFTFLPDETALAERVRWALAPIAAAQVVSDLNVTRRTNCSPRSFAGRATSRAPRPSTAWLWRNGRLPRRRSLCAVARDSRSTRGCALGACAASRSAARRR